MPLCQGEERVHATFANQSLLPGGRAGIKALIDNRDITNAITRVEKLSKNGGQAVTANGGTAVTLCQSRY